MQGFSETVRASFLFFLEQLVQSLLHHKVNKDIEDSKFRDERDENESFIFML